MADELASRARPISAAHADQYLVVSRGEVMRIRLILLSHKIRYRVFVYLDGRKMGYLGRSFSGSGDRNGRRLE